MRKYQALQDISSTNSIDGHFFLFNPELCWKKFQENALKIESVIKPNEWYRDSLELSTEKKTGENPLK